MRHSPPATTPLQRWLERAANSQRFAGLAATLFLGGFAAICIVQFGSISAALSYASGKRLLVDARTKSVGSVSPGRTAEISFQLRNVTPHAMTLQGAQTSCGCAVVNEVPCVIEARGTKSIRLTITAPDDGNRIDGTFTLFTDEPQASQIVLGYDGQVAKADPTH